MSGRGKGSPASRVIAGIAALTVAAALSFVAAPAAWADGDAGVVPARQAVLQAIAYIVNSPDDMAAITVKLKDAEAAQDTSGVDLALIRRAADAVAGGRLSEARGLLQQSIGAAVDLTGSDVRPILHAGGGLQGPALATGEQTGTQVVTDELPGRGPWTATDTTLLVVAAVLAVGGAWLSFRLRPAHSVWALRRPERTRGAR